jgi:hypothetical protein
MKTSSGETPLAITYDDIEIAAQRPEGQAHRTPTMTSRSFNADAAWRRGLAVSSSSARAFVPWRLQQDQLAVRRRARAWHRLSGTTRRLSRRRAPFGVPAVICMPTERRRSKSRRRAVTLRRALRPPD